MARVYISDIELAFPKFSYSISEIVDQIFYHKLEKDVREFAKNELGIDRVFKSYDLYNVDTGSADYVAPHVRLNDMYLEAASNIINKNKASPADISMLITINDNQQHLDPSPTVEIVSRMELNKNIRAQNLQGLACSSFCEALKNAAGHFVLNKNNSRALFLISSYYTSWFLDRIKQTKKISRDNKRDFHHFIYFLIFSDVAAAILVDAKKGANGHRQLATIDTERIFSLKYTRPQSYKKATLSLSPDSNFRIGFSMELDSKKLRDEAAMLCSENVKKMRKATGISQSDVKMWGFHTAGLPFVEYIRKKCKISKEKSKLSYDLMKSTGNTGAVSSVQIMKESIDKEILGKQQQGAIIDYGWEGSDLFLFHRFT